MFPSCYCGDLGHESFHGCIFPSSSKLQSPQFPLRRRSRVLLGFRLHKPTSDLGPSLYGGPNVSLGLKVRCVSGAIAPSTKKVSSIFDRDKDTDKPILRSLDSGSDIDKTHNSNLCPKHQTVVLRSQKGWESVVRVFENFYSQEDYVPNVIHYNIVLRALGLAEKWGELRLFWIRMAKDGLMPANHTYAVLVHVYGKAGFARESLFWIKHMRLMELFPNAVVMNTVVNVLKDAKEFDLAVRFYNNWRDGRVELDDLQLEKFHHRSGGPGPVSVKQFLSTEIFTIEWRSPNSKITASKNANNSLGRPLQTDTYNTLIDMYGKAGRVKDAADIFAEMLRYGVKMDTITFNSIISASGYCGNVWEAEQILSLMERSGPSPDTKTYNIFLSMYANAGDIDAVLRCYWKMRKAGLLPTLVTHRTVLHILYKRNMIREVEAVIEEMDKFRVAIDEHSIPGIVNMYVKAGLLDKANNLLERFQFCSSLSSKTRASVMDSFAEKGLWSEAEHVFFRKSGSIKQKNDVLEYNVMIKAYGMAKLCDKALSLFRGMKNQGVWPDECTYRSLIQMLAGADMVDRARHFLEVMRELGYEPDCLTFSSIIACYVRLNQLSDAVGVYQEMERAGVKPNEIVYGSLINGFAENGECEVAIDYFHKMEESGISANKVVLTSLIKAYRKLGSLEGAKAIYERMRYMPGGLDVVALNTMIDLFANFSLVSEAKLIFENLKENGLADTYTFATMMRLYKATLMIHEVNNIIDEYKVYGIPWNNVSLNEAMDCYVTTGQLRKCVELFHEMVPQKLLPDKATMEILITAMRKAADQNKTDMRRASHQKGKKNTSEIKADGLTEAVTQLESAYLEGKPYAMEAIITYVSSEVGLDDFALCCCESFIKADATLDLFAYNVAIKTYEKAGQVDKALNVYLKMQHSGLEPDVVTYINLAACYGKARMVEGLKRIHDSMKRGEIKPNKLIYAAVCDALKVARRYDLVYMVIGQMRIDFGDNSPNDGTATEDESDENDVYDDDCDEDYESDENDVYDDDCDEEYEDSRS